jgi:hypothetical protein
MKRLLIALMVLFVTHAHAETTYEYGAQCAREVARIPAFSCMAGEVIPITVNGKVTTSFTATCDKPSLLPATELGSQGQCIPGSRALALRDDKTTQISAICRKKVVRDPTSPLFDEINIISHNLKNGKTCWFTAKAAEPLRQDKGIDGRHVPTPTAHHPEHGYREWHEESRKLASESKLDPKQLPAPHRFWFSPHQVASSKPACVVCHDSGPFMYSPYIAQTTQLPGDPFGRYQPKAIGADFKRQWWDLNVFGLTTRGNTCTACHRIGNMNSCTTATLQSTGRAPQEGGNAYSQQFPQSHWMSPGNLHSQVQWNEAFATSLRKLAACCQNPKSAECQVVHYDGRKR